MRALMLVLVSAVTAVASSPDEQPGSVLHYQTRNSMMLVTVAIDGRNRTLIFDTGAEQTMINFPEVSREQKRNFGSAVTCTSEREAG